MKLICAIVFLSIADGFNGILIDSAKEEDPFRKESLLQGENLLYIKQKRVL